MKNLRPVVFSLLIIGMFSCRPAKKAQQIQKQITKNTNAKVVVVSDSTNNVLLDSLHYVINTLDSQKIDQYKTFSAKIKVDYQGANNSGQATANIRMRKDSLIWISLTGPFAIEAFRIKIKPDSILLMDKLHHTVMHKSINYLQQLMQIPVSFNDLQNIIIGNPTFTNGPIESFKHTHNKWFVSIKGKIFRNFITVIDNEKKLVLRHSLLQDSSATQNRKCDISYNNIKPLGSGYFSEARRILISDKTDLEIKLQYKDYSFDESFSYPFSIPKNYTWM